MFAPPAREMSFCASGLSCLLERRFDAVGHEREGCSPVETQRFSCIMSEHEHWVMERRIVPPPSVPGVLRLPLTRMAAKHIPSHHSSADVRQHLADNGSTCVDFSAVLTMHLAKYRKLKSPFVKPSAADPERVNLRSDEDRQRSRQLTSRS
jgi:hypothetical protein